MKTSVTGKRILSIALVLMAAVPAAGAQSIYKCTTPAGQLEYTDRPCRDGKGELIHQADDSEIIDQYLRLGQDAKAKTYADAHHLEALYQQRLAAHKQQLEDNAQRQADEAIAAQQRDVLGAQQQALADDAASRERLRAENDALRRQNDEYRDQLAQPIYNAPPAYWGAVSPYWNGHHDHDHDHDHDRDHDHDSYRPPPSKEPVFHPCTQLAGGRVQC
jgi:Putative GTPases (G3E family)